jgi:hypothetical protein
MLFDPKLKTPCNDPSIPPGPPGMLEALKAERERLGLTPEILEQRRRESLLRPF